MRKPAIVVTGASKGIGLAVTRLLLTTFNANVLAISRTRSPELLALNSDSLLVIQCDVTEDVALSNAISLGASRFNGIDGLILNAGTLDPLCRIGDDTPLDSWKHHFDVDFFSLVTAIKSSLPYLLQSPLGGRIVFVSSGAAVKGVAGWGPYNAGKAAMNSLCRTLAEEEPTITSVALRPGMVDTDMQASLRATGGLHMADQTHKSFVQAYNEGKLVKPEDCGHVIAALSLQAPKSLSGQFVSWDSEDVRPKAEHSFNQSLMLNDFFSSQIGGEGRRCIDVHHHYFPPDLEKHKSNATIGWKTPAENLPWSPEISLRAMDAMGIDFAVVSFPAISKGSISTENRAIARNRNEFAYKICQEYPNRFGFFATLPFLNDIEGCLHEIEYSLDNLHADGVSISSCYGEGSATTYIGDERYDPIWEELDRRKIVVFLHGSQIPGSTPIPHPSLGVPITEVPHETYKAAAHLVVTGNRRKFPNVKVILAHLGGSVPLLASRVAVLSNYMGCTLTPDEILQDFKSFYYETALSGYETNLTAIETFVEHDHILFGTDFPAVSTGVSEWFTNNVQKHYIDNEEKLKGVMCGNAVKLFSGSDKCI